MQKLRPIMFVGTGSDVGKSVVNAAFCRIFKQDGYSPAPYKAQNMSLNSYATPDGLEIGRAQAVQAEACQVPCHTDMNPVLLKPTTYKSAQVVLNGKPIGNQTAYEFFMGNNRHELFEEVKKAFFRLEERYSPVVMEGAGSISEINLRSRDITNMSIAIAAEAQTFLVADIDRGGVFASVYGTMQLLTPEERSRIKGIVINKFRGDARLFEEGKKMMEELCQVPVVGIIPYYQDIHIEEEDSVMLETKFSQASEGKVNVAVVLLKKMSNFTDFNVLERDDRVHLFYTNNVDEIAKADIVILPGSKSTIADLTDLRKNGVAKAVVQAHKDGKTVIGICGGFQMMGQSVEDPLQVESAQEFTPGLGILPVKTVLAEDKVTEQVQFSFKEQEQTCSGYEIHMGESEIDDAGAKPLAITAVGKKDGCWLADNCWGTYMHGILDNQSVVDDLLAPFASKIGGKSFDYAAFKEKQYNKLADHVRKHVDMDYIYRQLKEK